MPLDQRQDLALYILVEGDDHIIHRTFTDRTDELRHRFLHLGFRGDRSRERFLEFLEAIGKRIISHAGGSSRFLKFPLPSLFF
ncbi:MAG: hypothetical protein D6812_01560 [Deltaproteobacteria bacterium]|nr:MAG: hypothetical protein D6812_01560 [Deltaproteobacteria bacterium]